MSEGTKGTMRDSDNELIDTFMSFCARYKEKVFEGYTQKEILVQVLEHYEQCVLDVAHNMHTIPYAQQTRYSTETTADNKTFCKPETRGAMTPQQPTDDRKPTSEGVANNQAVFPCRMEATTSQQEFVTVPGPEDRSRQSDSRGSNGDAAVATIDSPMIFPCRHIDATGQNPFVASSRGSIFNPLLHQSYFTTTTNPLMPPSSSNPLNMPTAVPVCPMTAPSPLPGTAALTMQTVVTSANAVNIPQPVTTAVAMAMPPPASNPPRKHSRGGGGGGGGGGGANNNNGNAATPPIERRHPCRECGKRFKQMSHLKVHQRQRHSSERPYACDVCEKRFARGCDLNRHSRSHSRAPMHHFVSQVDPTAAAM